MGGRVAVVAAVRRLRRWIEDDVGAVGNGLLDCARVVLVVDVDEFGLAWFEVDFCRVICASTSGMRTRGERKCNKHHR